MKPRVKKLAEAIASAEIERAAWHAGRAAFREQGATALNPYPPSDPKHTLWADGVDTEREDQEARRKPLI